MKKNYLKMLLAAVCMVVGGSAWAGDKTVVKYSFDNATSPSLTAGSRTTLDYSFKSVATNTVFLNASCNTNGACGTTTVALTDTDLSGETWTLSFEWAGNGGCNSKTGHTYLKAGDTNLFDITDVSNWNTTVTLSYGTNGSATIPVPACNKSNRFGINTAKDYNTDAYWHHFEITGSDGGVKMTVTNSKTGAAIVSDVVLSETNVTPTALTLQPSCGGAIGIDELALTYAVEGDVIQTPTAAYTAVDGINRTITATCETEGVTIQHSTDGTTYEDGASVTVSESGNVYFKAVKGTSESDVLTFAAEAGEAITLNAPTIVRSDNTTVTISADQTALLLSPTATIYYEYGTQSGSFTGSKVLTVEEDATITAYAEATGYTTSATSERAVALFPSPVEVIENTPTKTAGTTKFSLGTTTISVSEREYVALLLDDVQWGTNVYLQNLTLSDPIVWGVRNGNWYINTTSPQWILMRNVKAGDVVVVDVTYAASDMVNATYSEKYTYGTKHAYVVTADGDAEFAVKKPNASLMDYIYGVYSYRPITSVAATIGDMGYSTFASTYPLDLDNLPEGLTAYYVADSNVKDNYISLTEATGAVAAGEGLLLKGTAGASYDIPVATVAGMAIEGNYLKGVTDAGGQEVGGMGKYVLVNDDVTGNVMFAMVFKDPSNYVEATVPAGKAYLDLTAAILGNAKERLFINFGGEATAINGVEAAQKTAEGAIYNVAGQRVNNGYKGIVIKNGKKVLNR